MESKNNAMEVVLSYIRALDSQDYDAAREYMCDRLPIKGPGEPFDRPEPFIEMLRRFQGKYDVKKVFCDEDDVCLMYDLITPVATVFMCSWYQVKDGKIASIQTVFDPRHFGPQAEKRSS